MAFIPKKKIDTLMRRLGEIPDKDDQQNARFCIVQCLRRGFTDLDVVRYTRLTEHVSPTIRESYALEKMKEISEKYKHNGKGTSK